MKEVRLKLTIAFDGSAYHGWHAGRSGRGVSDHLEKALAVIFPDSGGLIGSSRTDAGVHALGLVAHVDVADHGPRLSTRRVVPAMNALLPSDIRVLSAARTCGEFHARFGATRKEYRYQIWNGPVMNPLLVGRAWHVPDDLDVAAMRQAAALLIGRHDFRAFTSRRGGVLGKTERTLDCCRVKRSGRLLTLVLRGDGFLYKMCRAITGTLVRVGRGASTVADVAKLLDDAQSAAVSRLNAPAHGLILWKVSYSPRDGAGAWGTDRNPDAGRDFC